jgi:hypothetical protein
MHMVGHNDTGIHRNIGKPPPQSLPFAAGNLTQAVQPDLLIHNLAKQRVTVLGDDGNEICSWLRIIVARQPDGTPLVYLLIVPHAANMRSFVSRNTSAGLPSARSASRPPACTSSGV